MTYCSVSRMARNIVLFCFVCFTITAIIIWTLQFVFPSSICYYYNLLAYLLLGGLIAYEMLPFTKKKFFDKKLPVGKKAVLITGSGSGIGFDLAKRLDSRGYHVFASCHNPSKEGPQILKKLCSDHMHVFGVDVTDNESVKKALDYVKENLNGNELWAVVNNAGTNVFAETEWSPIKCFQDVMDVNTMGAIRVTKTFLPLIRRSKGRIVTVSSVMAHLPSRGVAAYCMSKYANVCFSDCLRQEMHPWGVKVISVEPEAFRTPLADYANLSLKVDEIIKCLDTVVKEDYGEDYFQEIKKLLKILLEYSSKKLYKVSDAIEDAISLEEPSNVYSPSNDILRYFALKISMHIPSPLFNLCPSVLCSFLVNLKPKKVESEF